MNSVVMLGNLVRDVETRVTKSGTNVAGFTVGDSYKRKVGDKWEAKASFIACKAFGKTAENIAKYFAKGSKILVRGKLDQETWEKDGKQNTRLVVLVDEWAFCEKPTEKAAAPKAASNDDGGGDDDVPF